MEAVWELEGLPSNPSTLAFGSGAGDSSQQGFKQHSAPRKGTCVGRPAFLIPNVGHEVISEHPAGSAHTGAHATGHTACGCPYEVHALNTCTYARTH